MEPTREVLIQDLKKNRMRSLSVALGLAITMSACGSDADGTSAPQAPAPGGVVVLEATSFEPADVVIDAGTSVTWQWAGGVAHDVAGSGFASDIQTDGDFQHQFERPGDYPYRCNLHPGMKGTVTVVSA